MGEVDHSLHLRQRKRFEKQKLRFRATAAQQTKEVRGEKQNWRELAAEVLGLRDPDDGPDSAA